MAARIILQRRAITPIVASALAASIILYPQRTLHAEAPRSSPPQQPPLLARKPIYSDFPSGSQAAPTTTAGASPTPAAATTTTTTKKDPQEPPTTLRPTPTDHLTTLIRSARLSLQSHTSTLETSLNTLFSTLLTYEAHLTSSLASLAPPASSHEHLLPGSLYVLVATLAGSIVTRNRNIAVRVAGPVGLGWGVAWVVLPVTMGNVSRAVWGLEEGWPALARGHLRVQGAVEEGWRKGEDWGGRLSRWGGSVVGEAREGVVGWVKGR